MIIVVIACGASQCGAGYSWRKKSLVISNRVRQKVVVPISGQREWSPG
ncbi:hypothetical protein FRUB_03230 [Fimbriiglobus ruber]|uniref:Uncharacterized protein n=1 Tax=Fimbriiglobus ruber TaxID=1908690 RepID=A0A225DQQ6_9BACT|nr:hypothetical protein FRUB_03230 [Fimbriiglobus ruber]